MTRYRPFKSTISRSYKKKSWDAKSVLKIAIPSVFLFVLYESCQLNNEIQELPSHRLEYFNKNLYKPFNLSFEKKEMAIDSLESLLKDF